MLRLEFHNSSSDSRDIGSHFWFWHSNLERIYGKIRWHDNVETWPHPCILEKGMRDREKQEFSENKRFRNDSSDKYLSTVLI